jgi:hypothetical protein
VGGRRARVSGKWPVPTRSDHQRFCELEGWTRVRNATGKTGHHVTYELALPDGSILRTRISHPPDRSTYGPGLWHHILRDQLAVDEAVFWACLSDGTRPERGRPGSPRDSLPAGLVSVLLHQVGLLESEVALLTRDEAIARVNDFWTTGD